MECPGLISSQYFGPDYNVITWEGEERFWEYEGNTTPQHLIPPQARADQAREQVNRPSGLLRCYQVAAFIAGDKKPELTYLAEMSSF